MAADPGTTGTTGEAPKTALKTAKDAEAKVAEYLKSEDFAKFRNLNPDPKKRLPYKIESCRVDDGTIIAVVSNEKDNIKIRIPA